MSAHVPLQVLEAKSDLDKFVGEGDHDLGNELPYFHRHGAEQLVSVKRVNDFLLERLQLIYLSQVAHHINDGLANSVESDRAARFARHRRQKRSQQLIVCRDNHHFSLIAHSGLNSRHQLQYELRARFLHGFLGNLRQGRGVQLDHISKMRGQDKHLGVYFNKHFQVNGELTEQVGLHIVGKAARAFFD